MVPVRVSVVIPAYNEASCIAATLMEAHGYLVKQRFDSEIIVVDDGSSDGTAAIVRDKFPAVRVITYPRNRGKGHAVRTGMLAAAGELRVFSDADGSTPIGELDKLMPYFNVGADIVIGSRMMKQSNIVVRQRWARERMGRLFNVALHAQGLTPFNDTQCGFKAFTSRAAEICFQRQTLDGFIFDVEILAIAQCHGLRIVEVPIKWINNPDSRVHMLRDAIPTLRDLLAIRANLRAGKYG